MTTAGTTPEVERSRYRAPILDTTERVTVWQDPKDRTTIFVSVRNPLVTAEDGSRPGFMFRVSSNPRSADYNPGTFNRCVRLLRALDKDAPAEVPIHTRELRSRPRVIRELGYKPL